MAIKYAIKKPGAWLWKTSITRESIEHQLRVGKITGGWLICPLGEPERALGISNFMANPNVFDPPLVSPVKVRNSPLPSGLPSEETSVPRFPRRHDLDALRAVAVLLGIVIHGILAYIPLPEVAFPVQDIRQSRTFGVVLGLIHGFRMPLFFLLSGFFTAMLWRRLGVRALLRHRYKRVGVPLAVSMVTILPLLWVVGLIATEVSRPARTLGHSELWTAVVKDDLEAIRLSIAEEGRLNEREPAFGTTALSLAASNGNGDVVEALLAGGANVNARNRDGSTALHTAALWGMPDAARILIENGIDLQAKNRLGETAADMIQTEYDRIFITAALRGDEPGDLSGRKEVARLLAQVGGSEKDLGMRDDFETSGAVLAVMLLKLFPVFGHLWFLWLLCWLVLVFAIFAKVTRFEKWKPPAWLAISPIRYLWLIVFTLIPQATMGRHFPTFGPDTSAGLLPVPSVFFYYVIFFFYGAIYFKSDDVAGQVGRRWRLTLPVALVVVFPLGYELMTGDLGFLGSRTLDSNWGRAVAVSSQVVFAWMMSFGLIGFFREFFSRENQVLRYLSDSSYWLYLIHLPVIIFFQTLMWEWRLPAMVKFSIVLIATTAVTVASYQYCVRYTGIGAMLNGPRERQKPIPSDGIRSSAS